MKTLIFLKFIVLLVFLNVSSLCAENRGEKANAATNNDISQFLGQWTFDIGSGGLMNAGWLDVRQEDGYLDADLMWGGGGIFYGLPYVYATEDVLYLGRSSRNVDLARDDEGNATLSRDYPTWIEIKRDGENLTGYYLRPKTTGIGVDSIMIKGTKLPEVPSAPDLSELNFGEPINLIKEHNDLAGWKLMGQNSVNGWSVKEGVLSNNPVQEEGERIGYGNIRTEQEFEDFNLQLEVNVPSNGNSGIYLRGMHEVQISDSYEDELTSGGSIGAIFTRIVPTVNAEKPAGEWQTMDITFCDRHVTVELNGVTIVDNQPVHGVTGGAMQSDVFAPGPIYLQGDHTAVSFRNMVLTPII